MSGKEGPLGDNNHSIMHSFESVCINPSTLVAAEDVAQCAEVAVHLPNKIRCDIKMDLRNDAFATLLKQLVTLC